MSTPHLLPYDHPCSIAVIDDSSDFLLNLSLRLDPHLSYRLFRQPSAALDAIEFATDSELTPSSLFTPYCSTEDLPDSHQIVGLDIGRLWRKVHDPARFQRIAVVVVDYDMPEMDGLELCTRLTDPTLRKILLTGKADENIAIEAFNLGLIDRFILKQRQDCFATLNREIGQLMQSYLELQQQPLAAITALGPASFLQDPAFVAGYVQLREQYRIVEHYLLDSPRGLLMLDADGSHCLLAVMDRNDLAAQYEIAELQGAPRALLEALRNETVVPYFPQGHYDPSCVDWRSCLHPAREIRGNHVYRCALLLQPAGIDLRGVRSYAEHLRLQDASGCHDLR